MSSARKFTGLGLYVALLLTLQACSSAPKAPGANVREAVAILGVTTSPSVTDTLSDASLNSMLRETLHESGRFASMEAKEVHKAMGDVRYSAMMGAYRDTGSLRYQDVQVLMASQLPVNYAIVGRIEQNDIVVGETPSAEEKARNAAGEIQNDRVRETYSTQRTVALSATMINLRNGSPYWTRTYKAAPVTNAIYTRYHGSSFAGSLAATMANTVANGIRRPTGPAAASLPETMQTLLREVVRSMTAR